MWHLMLWHTLEVDTSFIIKLVYRKYSYVGSMSVMIDEVPQHWSLSFCQNFLLTALLILNKYVKCQISSCGICFIEFWSRKGIYFFLKVRAAFVAAKIMYYLISISGKVWLIDVCHIEVLLNLIFLPSICFAKCSLLAALKVMNCHGLLKNLQHWNNSCNATLSSQP